MPSPVHIICVVNKFEVCNSVIRDYPYMSGLPIDIYDNTKENIGVSKRYNDFINGFSHDAWLIFCHQDFGFLEDAYDKIKDLDKNFIYGPIGAVRRWGFFIRNSKIRLKKKILLGQINQANNGHRFYKNGIYIKKPRLVETIDCCCIIVHSSLIKRYNLRFDEHFEFHLYAEDLSLGALYKHGIKTKAVQIECRHLSLGNASRDFYESLEYLKSKYKGREFVGTCF